MLVKFTEDTVVDPRGSEWFSWFRSENASEMVPVQETKMYQEDWIGLKVILPINISNIVQKDSVWVNILYFALYTEVYNIII